MQKTNTSIRLWDYAYDYAEQIRYLTVTNQFLLKNRTPFEDVKGCTPDISEFITLKQYDWYWYYNQNDIQKKQIARWLGPAYNARQSLGNYVLTTTGEILMRSTVIPFLEENNSEADITDVKTDFKEKMNLLLVIIKHLYLMNVN